VTNAETHTQAPVAQRASGEPLDFERLEALAPKLCEQFRAGTPFPHIVIDDFLPLETANRVRAEFDETREGWDLYHHFNENKLAVSSLDPLGPHTRVLFDALQSRRFVDWAEELTGIEDLVSDPDLDGAGLHKIEPGGFLNVHTDFLAHTKNRTWSRQVNLLLYFNRDWKPEWNGDLELWDKDVTRCERSIAPLFNRCVLFHTAEKSYHGHPRRLACPPGETRKSIALYYFRDEGAPRAVTSTHYHPLPDDPLLKRWLVVADRGLLRAYSIVKRYTGLSNQLASRILKRF
jgi:Rps23 Pro-64 3,4-dihydroxylase Tpa1-like proline 4-hydroxylase